MIAEQAFENTSETASFKGPGEQALGRKLISENQKFRAAATCRAVPVQQTPLPLISREACPRVVVPKVPSELGEGRVCPQELRLAGSCPRCGAASSLGRQNPPEFPFTGIAEPRSASCGGELVGTTIIP